MSATTHTPQDEPYSQRSYDGLEIRDEYSNLHQPGLEHWRNTPQSDELNSFKPSVFAPQAQKEVYPGHPVSEQAPVNQGRRDNGSVPRRFWWIIGGIILLAIAAVARVGGGLGASLAQCQRQKTSSSSIPAPTLSPTSTSTSTSTRSTTSTTSSGLLLAYQAVPTDAIYTIYSNCSILPSVFTNSIGDKYSINCDRNLNLGISDQTDSSGNFLPLADIVSIVAYALSDCTVACSQYTIRSGQIGRTQRCAAVTFSPNFNYESVARGGYGTNCWLKNGTVASISSGTSYYQGYISAMLT